MVNAYSPMKHLPVKTHVSSLSDNRVIRCAHKAYLLKKYLVLSSTFQSGHSFALFSSSQLLFVLLCNGLAFRV